MKNLDHRISTIKYKVYQMRKNRKGKGHILEPLTRAEYEVLKRMFVVKPWLYKVKISFPQYLTITDATENILKELFYYRKETGKKIRYIHLSNRQVRICRNAGLEVKLVKYKIY